jgi:DNA invertase Pin-like site-specific DNA recombinase
VDVIVDGYVRVSRVDGRSGERFLSPQVQREQIERWAHYHGARIAHVFEELDESGARTDRPLVQEAIKRVERGVTEGVVVAYLSRFGRSLIDGLNAIQRITDAGGTFVSVGEGLDFSTDTGRLLLRLMFSFAEFEVDRTRSSWAVATERAVARGVFVGNRPFGYQRGLDGRLRPDVVEAPLVREMYRRRVDGASQAELRRYLMATGVPTSVGGLTWHPSSVRVILRSRAYRGEIHHGEFVNSAAHEPLVDEVTWQLAQHHAQQYPPRLPRPAALLRGILRCASCGRVMTAAMTRTEAGHDSRQYRCPPLDTSPRCPASVRIRDAMIEPYVERLFWQELSRSRRSPDRLVDEAAEHLARRERELEAYRDNPSLPLTLGSERYQRGLELRVRRTDDAMMVVARRTREARDRTSGNPVQLRLGWAAMSLDQRREAIGRVIECVFIAPGRDLEARVVALRRGDAPVGLPPVHPRSFTPVTPMPSDAVRRRVKVRPRKPWAEQRIRSQLGAFVEGRSVWPSFPEFQSAGLGVLYAELRQTRGHLHWAAAYGLRYIAEPAAGRVGAWDEDRVRTDLANYLRGKSAWPTCRQFSQDGRDTLRRAVRWFGGPERWAREFAVEMSWPQQRRSGWTYSRMHAELAALVGEQRVLPSCEEFRTAGHNALYRAMCRAGVRDQLAQELGLRIRRGKVYQPSRWTDENVSSALDQLLAGRATWPTRPEFQAAGLGGLHHRLQRGEGIDTWARRYGLPRAAATRASGWPLC